MAEKKSGKTDKDLSTPEDIGAAMMAWYAESIKEHPEGLVTQAQASTMLGVSRVAISRLISRGHLRPVYFPKPPDIVGIAVGHDDPTWLKIISWLGDWDKTYAFPKAVFVSFGDVVNLWNSGQAKQKCRRDWDEIMTGFKPENKRQKELREIQADYQKQANEERARDKENS